MHINDSCVVSPVVACAVHILNNNSIDIDNIVMIHTAAAAAAALSDIGWMYGCKCSMCLMNGNNVTMCWDGKCPGSS